MTHPISASKIAAAERRLSADTEPITGRIRQPRPTGPTTFYTDGSVSRRRVARIGWLTGWGYLSTDGRYGCSGLPQLDGKVGDDPALTTELRAVWHAIGAELPARPVTVITDSRRAIAILTAWQAGSTTMPASYRGSSKKTPTLELLRQAVAANPDHLTTQHVPGHSGDVLNEGADTLAQLGMRWRRDQLDRDTVARRAEGIAEGFLADYRRRHP